MNAQPTNLHLTRRMFLGDSALALGGLAFGLPLTTAVAAEADAEVTAWVLIRPDNKVIIRIARSEMGQGTLTGLAQLVAEELECDWANVSTEFPTAGANLARKRVWGDFSTGGSRGIRASHLYVRQGGAAARMMLVQAAAARWKVDPAACTVSKGVITHEATKRKLTYGKVAADAAKLEIPKDPALKDPKTWTIAGKPLKRLDTAAKVTGALKYGIDTQLPGMLTATIRDCPVNGGKVKSFDKTAALAIKGVRHVLAVGDSGVAVVADTFWQAKKGADALVIEWDNGPNGKVDSAQIAEILKQGLDADQAFVGNQNGDVTAAVKSASKVVEAVYAYPYQHHATMEPMNATARITADRCEVWAPTQNGEAALATAAEASGLPASQCEVYKMILGGGFGRRGRSDYVRQAVLIAKQLPGIPVKLIWTREEDMTHCSYHPITQAKLTGALDGDGNLTGLHMRISGQSILAGLAPQSLQNGKDPAVFQGLVADGTEGVFGYDVPNILIDHAMRNPHLLPGFWRGVNINQNTIYLESFIDELAYAAGADPLAFRLKMIKPRNRAVLEAVAARANYGKAPAGRAHGLAHIMAFGSYVAACAEVSIDAKGALKIHKIVAATNPGIAVNPAQIERQVAGSFVYGLSALLYGAITVKDGAPEQTNFDSYNVMRIDEMPEVETIILPTGDFWGGVGEPTISVAAPAVLNAIYAATGKRIRTFPLAGQDLRKA
jgi:isoquinoline 1-oxidoreductase beta subunit